MIDSFSLNYDHERAISHFVNKEYSEAEFFYKRVCHKTPNGKNWMTRGLCFKFMEMYESAIYCFQRSLDLEKSESTTHYHIGSSLVALKKYKKGIDYLNKAMELAPDFELPYYMKSLAKKFKTT